MENDQIELQLLPSPDDPRLESSEYQKELENFYRELNSQGGEVSPYHYAFDAIDGGGGLTGEFLLLATASLPVMGKVLIAWIKSRSGRKIRLEIGKDGKIKAEAQTPEEISKLLEIAENHGNKSKSKEERLWR